MTGRRKFSELVAKMPPERQARIAQMTEELREEMDLAQGGCRRRRPSTESYGDC
jgi:hypothetical protein